MIGLNDTAISFNNIDYMMPTIDTLSKATTFVTDGSNAFRSLEPSLRNTDGDMPFWIVVVLLSSLMLLVVNKHNSQGKLFGSFNFTGILAFLSYICVLSLLFQRMAFICSGNFSYTGVGFFFQVFIIVTICYALKFASIFITGWLYKLSEAAYNHIVACCLYGLYAMLFMIPFIVFLFFYPNKIVCVGGTIVLATLFIVKTVSVFLEIRKSLKINLVNYFLYLCGHEIAPLLAVVATGYRFAITGVII